MAGKLPLCASCGKSVVRKSRVKIVMGNLRGAPFLVWHNGDCFRNDSTAQELMDNLDVGNDHVEHGAVVVVTARGDGRIGNG